MTLLWCIHKPLVSVLKMQLKMKCFFSNFSGMGKCKWENMLYLNPYGAGIIVWLHVLVLSFFSEIQAHLVGFKHWRTTMVIMTLEAVDRPCWLNLSWTLNLKSEYLYRLHAGFYVDFCMEWTNCLSKQQDTSIAGETASKWTYASVGRMHINCLRPNSSADLN